MITHGGAESEDVGGHLILQVLLHLYGIILHGFSPFPPATDRQTGGEKEEDNKPGFSTVNFKEEGSREKEE